jgi:surfeit locus 1 family protein
MTARLKDKRFLVLTVAALLMVSLTFSLGQWQLRRAAQKLALQAAVESQQQLPALDNRALLATNDLAAVMHRPVTLTGHWQTEHTVYLDNRPMDGKTGFWVLTPLLLTGGKQSIVVQRGWVPRNFNDRTQLAQVLTPADAVTVSGRIAPPPSRLYEFADAGGGRIRQNVDLVDFGAETGLPLLQVSLLQTGPASEGLLRDWPAPTSGVDRHYGYAFQWFALCVLLIGLYVWFQLILPRRAKRAT